MTGLTSTNSTPLPYPKSKSTSSLEENVIATSGSVNLVNVQLNLSSTSSTGSSSNLILGERTLSGSILNPYQHSGAAAGTGPCGGFSTQYAWMCDLHGLPYREEVAWVRSYSSSTNWLLPLEYHISLRLDTHIIKLHRFTHGRRNYLAEKNTQKCCKI